MTRADVGTSAARAFMSIGEVLSHLRPEFPDTTISKLRFLESEGLVEPERTPAGYRKYTASDVARLRYVLRAQRDHYLPLRVIRENLEALDRGLPVPDLTLSPQVRSFIGSEGLPADSGRGGDDSRLSRTEFLEESGLEEEFLRELEQFGLILRRPGGYYDTEAVMIARIVDELRQFGLEPRHLRAYRTAADREVGLFEQVVKPVAGQRGPEAKARAAETVRQLAGLSVRLHTALVQVGLRSVLGA